MEIIGKVEVKGFLRASDLEYGYIFIFLDDNRPCMLCADNYDMYIVDLDSGAIEGVIGDFPERPIRRLKAKLIIED